MALEYKKRSKQNLLRYEAGVIDTSANSPDYFRVSSIPEYFGNGKNAFRILGSDSDLLAPNSEIKIEVLDSKGNAIYHEIPNYQATDGSRLVTVWIYSGRDVSRENTPQGVGTIVIVGITRDNQLVRWTRSIPIRPTEPSIAPIIFQSPNLPTATCSASLDSYSSIPQTADGISLTTQSTKVKYIKSNYGEDISLQRSGSFGSNFTGEMVDGEIRLDLSDITLYPQSKGTSQPTDYTGSIKAISGSDIIRLVAPITASDPRGDGSTHTYIYSDTADISGSIIFFSSASNASTENFEAVANITIPNLSPILGNVYSLNTSIKSKGFGGDFEILANTRITTDTNITYKVKIPSKHIGDPKTLRIQFLNKNGEISDSVILIEDVIFEGANSYIGGQNSLITGSIFISNALGSGIEIGGASSGFIRSVGFDGQTSASLGLGPGGFIFYSGSGNLQVGADTLNGVGMQMIGDNDDRHFIFTTENGGLLDVKTDKFFVGTLNTQFISGSDGNIEISSSIFHLDPAANGGDGSLIIGANATILSDLSVDNLRTPAVVNGAPSTEANASSSIKSDGFARFVSASIGGWDITTGSIEGGNLIMRPEGILQTRNFASGLKGWKISSEGNGTAEFENVRIRGTLRTTTFEKESVNAVGGQLWIANATTITGSVLSTETTMSVKNASGFSQGEILLIKRVDGTGFQTEYVLLDSASIDGDNSGEDETHGRIMVTRAYGSGESAIGNFVGDLASAAQAYEDGQVIVSTGKLNTGYIKMNANPNDTSTPFIDIVERTGSGLYDVALKARIGDLGGIAGNDLVYGNSNPGFGIATDNVFLQGGIIARTGSIGGINMEAGKLFIGTGTHGNSNTGFYVDSSSNFSLGDRLVWDNDTLTITGSLVDIRVSKFILGQIGGSDASYISGSDGNIEISASNFHLSSSGDVTVKGDITAETGTFKDVNVLGGNVQLGASGSHNVTEKYRSSTGTLLDYPIYPGQEPITVSDAPLWVETWVTQSNPAVTVADNWQLKDVIGSGVGTGAVAKHTIGSDGKLFGGQNVWNRFRTAEVGAISGNYQIGHYSASLTLEAIRGYGIGPNAARGANDYGSIESTKQFRTILSMGGDIEDYEQPIYVSSGSWSGSEKLFNDAVSFLKPILRNLPRNGKIQGIFPRYMDTSNIGENYRIGITSDPIVIGQEITLSDVLTLQFDASFSGNWDGFGFIVRAEILTEGGTVLGTFEQISNNPKHVLQFDIPLSQTLRTVTSYAPSIVDVFRIRVSWYQKTILGGGSPGVATQIKLSEMRIVKGVRSTSLNVGMLSVNNKVAITGREITTSNSVQPVMVINGNITPEESGIYSLGENSLYQGFQRYWKDFYMNGKMQLFDGSTTKFFVDKNAVSSSNIYPLTTDIYSVGKSSSQYKSFWGGSSQYLQYGYNPTFNNASSFTEVTTVNGVTNGQGYRMPIGGKITHLSGQCDVVSGGLSGRYLRVGIWKNNVQQFILGQGYQNLIPCWYNGDRGGNLVLSSYVSYQAGDTLMLKIQVSNVNLSVDDIALIMRVQEEL